MLTPYAISLRGGGLKGGCGPMCAMIAAVGHLTIDKSYARPAPGERRETTSACCAVSVSLRRGHELDGPSGEKRNNQRPPIWQEAQLPWKAPRWAGHELPLAAPINSVDACESP
jgi:hypothetical protein